LSEQLKHHLSLLKQASTLESLEHIHHGLEKESLRVNPQGHLAMSPHPAGLGSALTHSSITTDFSEALMEFITPVFQNPADSIGYLKDLHTFTYSQLPREELLWTSSMPCVISNDEDIPLAQYGSSNVGRLKTLYRKGLGYRYGRTMQTIAGIHYNFSLPDSFWPMYHRLLKSDASLQDFKTTQYFNLIRNFRRYSWLLIYLFGASPALCRSFVRNNPRHGLESYDDHTIYMPYGTSLRMGDLGYTSKAQSSLYISYNSLAEYADGLQKAIKTSYPPYAEFRSEDGSPVQLNNNVLQIENEFYSTIRPKRVVKSGQRPVHALRESGVEYIEVRLIDLNPFLPVGIDEQMMTFINCFLLFCLFRNSPPSDRAEYHEIDTNLKSVVKYGRDPTLQLSQRGQTIGLRDWASEILGEAEEIAVFLDSIHGGKDHTVATRIEQAKVSNPELTPSARVLARMQETKTTYFRFAMNQSLANSDYFRAQSLSSQKQQGFAAMGSASLADQQAIEARDTLAFDEYLANLNGS